MAAPAPTLPIPACSRVSQGHIEMRIGSLWNLSSMPIKVKKNSQYGSADSFQEGIMVSKNSDLSQNLLELVAREGMVDISEIKPENRLEDLDIQSADFVMILMALEEEYGVYISVDNELSDVETVQDLLNLAQAKIEEHQKETNA
ncbi:phosphopantetheine-binding protein [Shimia gijangensis]|nr:phosphopantetheine-binding protein [Shimia gijangensis]